MLAALPILLGTGNALAIIGNLMLRRAQ